jgi:protein-disulfide isomerase
MSHLVLPIGPGDHILGDVNAPVTLLEYGDYECPYCGRAHPIVQEVLRRVGPEVRLVFRHFPLAQTHPHALMAAEAAEAAGGQGKFWAMHDTLFENQDALEFDDLVSYAEAVGVNRMRFVQDLEAHTYLQIVKRDFRSGVRSGVNATPTFFIEGERFDEDWDPEILTAALRAAILRKAA